MTSVSSTSLKLALALNKDSQFSTSAREDLVFSSIFGENVSPSYREIDALALFLHENQKEITSTFIQRLLQLNNPHVLVILLFFSRHLSNSS